MESLELESLTSRKLNLLERKAIDVIGSLLDGAENHPEFKVKAALHTLNVIEKNRRTMAIREQTRYSMATRVFNKEQLRKYVQSTQPEIKKLAAGN